MKYILLDKDNEINNLICVREFNDLKEIYDFLLTQIHGVDAIKLSENKEGGWNVKYQIGYEWYTSLIWEIKKSQETENVS